MKLNIYYARMAMSRGALIVLEGVDRSGKSTQCRKLVESLAKKNCLAELMVFPDRTTATGKLISQYLSDKDLKLHDKAVHLLFAANRWENAHKMSMLLEKGVTLIVDRYSFSGIAYSAIKPGMDIDWCKTQEVGLPKPDAVFLLTLSPEEMKARPGFGGERYEKQSTQQKVLNVFHKLKDSSWELIDANNSIENIHELLLGKVLTVIDRARNQPITTLTFANECCNWNPKNNTKALTCCFRFSGSDSAAE